jgi:hypothetical protein
LQAAGSVNLGALRLPHFDEQTKTFRVAECTLGTLSVAASPSVTSLDKTAKLPPMPAPRTSFENPERHLFLADYKLFVPILFTLPGLGLLVAAGAFLRANRARKSEQRSQHQSLRNYHTKLLASLSARDPRGIGLALRPHLDALALAQYAVAPRALTLGELRYALIERGCPDTTAALFVELYERAGELGYGSEPIAESEIEALRIALRTLEAPNPRAAQ